MATQTFFDIPLPILGKTIYVEVETGQVLFAKPSGPNVVIAPNDGLQFIEFFDDQARLNFYHNPATGQTEWRRPLDQNVILMSKQHIHRRPFFNVPESDSEENRVADGVRSWESICASIRPGPKPVTKPTPRPDSKLRDYAENNFAVHKKGLMGGKLTVEEMLTWDKNIFQGPILKSEFKSGTKKDIAKIFKLIQQYMDDKPPKGMTSHGQIMEIIVNSGIVESPDVRDEIMLFLFRQLNRNPSRDSTIKGWELLSIILSMCETGLGLFPYACNHLAEVFQQAEKSGDIQIASFALHCLRRMSYANMIEFRSRSITEDEIDRLKESALKASVFQISLEDIVSRQLERYPNLFIPHTLIALTDSILVQANGQKTESIFRVKPDPAAVANERAVLDAYKHPISKDGHVLGQVLKEFLSEISDGIVPAAQGVQLLMVFDDVKKLLSKTEHLRRLHRECLHWIIRFLQEMTRPEVITKTKVSLHEICEMFGPLVFRIPQSEFTIAATARSKLALRLLILHLAV